MAYSGGILTLDQLERCLLDDVLLARPLERRLGATYVRQWGAAFADNFPSSRAVEWTEADMRRKGRAAQAKECARRLAAGGPRGDGGGAHRPPRGAQAGGGSRRLRRAAAVAAQARTARDRFYAVALRVATSAGAVDVAAALVAARAPVGRRRRRRRRRGARRAWRRRALVAARRAFASRRRRPRRGLPRDARRALASCDAAHRIVGARAALAGRGGSAEVVALDLASPRRRRAAARRARARPRSTCWSGAPASSTCSRRA